MIDWELQWDVGLIEIESVLRWLGSLYRDSHSKYMPVQKILDKITNFQKIKNLLENFKKSSLVMSMPKGQLQRTYREKVVNWRTRRLENFCFHHSHPQISSWGAGFYRDPYTNRSPAGNLRPRAENSWSPRSPVHNFCPMGPLELSFWDTHE